MIASKSLTQFRDKKEIVINSEDDMGGVGHLFISEFHLEEKQIFTPLQFLNKNENISAEHSQIKIFIPDYSIENSMKQFPYLEQLIDLVQIRMKKASLSTTSHLYYVTACCNYNVDEQQLLELLEKYDISPSLEMFAIFQKLEREIPQFTQQMLHCVLQISDMTHFNSINQAYCYFFLKSHTLNRPSRVCIATSTRRHDQQPRNDTNQSIHEPKQNSIHIECLMDLWKLPNMGVFNDSKEGNEVETTHNHPYMHSSLFVQSVSEWAPACIGPYAQASAHEKIIRLAGQIPLIPHTMELRTCVEKNNTRQVEEFSDKNEPQVLLKNVEIQMEQCLKNLSQVLDGMRETSLRDCFRNCVYVNATRMEQESQLLNTLVTNSNNNEKKTFSTLLRQKVNERLNEVLRRKNLCGWMMEEKMNDDGKWFNKNDPLRNFQLPCMVMYVKDLPRGALVEIHSFAFMKKLHIPSDDDEEEKELPKLDVREDVSLVSEPHHSGDVSSSTVIPWMATNIRVLKVTPSFVISTFLIRNGKWNQLQCSPFLSEETTEIAIDSIDANALKSVLALNETKKKPSIIRVFCTHPSFVHRIQQLLSDWIDAGVVLSPYMVHALAEEDALCRLEMEYL